MLDQGADGVGVAVVGREHEQRVPRPGDQVDRHTAGDGGEEAFGLTRAGQVEGGFGDAAEFLVVAHAHQLGTPARAPPADRSQPQLWTRFVRVHPGRCRAGY
ncbi:hypothetical protein [Glycomyces dulcitolivorans]|uniref:hypothetical protein n=1 Tax=Glycomyces dulcitolivorans TaxID=2200759 RepID=UPI001E2F091B|nr:hypothetical protein [Glycomyces dulcitolivorans]